MISKTRSNAPTHVLELENDGIRLIASLLHTYIDQASTVDQVVAIRTLTELHEQTTIVQMTKSSHFTPEVSKLILVNDRTDVVYEDMILVGDY